MTQFRVIALHCSGSSAKQWRSLVQRLGEAYPSWCPEFIGSGSRGHWLGDRPFTLADEAAFIVGVIDFLQKPVHLIGHSYGGAVALRIARERPTRIASLTLYEPMAVHLLKTAGFDGQEALGQINRLSGNVDRFVLAGDHRAAAETFVDYWSSPGAWTTLREQAQSDLMRYIPKACLEFRAVASESTALATYRHFQFPVLLLQGQLAPAPTQVIARQLARALRFGSLQTLPGAGHMGPLTHADMVADLMGDFIERQEAYGSAKKTDASALFLRHAA
jgi:pimeloyl-ACP methyl ester carboxylesterase